MKKVFNPTVWLTVFVIVGTLGFLSGVFDPEAAATDTWGTGNVLEHDATYELALQFAFLAFPLMALFTLIFIPGRQVRARILTAITIGFLVLPISFVSVFFEQWRGRKWLGILDSLHHHFSDAPFHQWLAKLERRLSVERSLKRIVFDITTLHSSRVGASLVCGRRGSEFI